MYNPQRIIHTPYGGLLKVMPDGSIRVVRRDFGLTWEDECSREAHRKMYEYLTGEPCPPEYYLSDPPSVTRPPEEPQPVVPVPPIPPPPPGS